MQDALQKMTSLVAWIVPIIILGSIILPQAIRILREYERGVIFRLGKLLGAKGPGLILLIPVVDRMVKMDLRVVTIDVARQEVMTRDNVPVTVDAVVFGVRTRYTEKHGAVLVIFRCVLTAGEPQADNYEINAAEFLDAVQIKALEPVFPLSREMGLRVLEDVSNGLTEREIPPTSSATWKAFTI